MDRTLILAVVMVLLLPIAFGVQVNSSTEIYSFNVTNCIANESNIGCDPADVTFSCDISNYAFIDYTKFRIEGTDYTTTQNLNSFSYSWHKGMTVTSTNTTIDFQRGAIYDVSNGTSLFYPTAFVRLDCITCNWTIIPGACNLNDTHIVEYIGDSTPNCTSFNMTESCDYCTPDWSITSTCGSNNSEFRTYNDANNCYSTTNLYSDSCDNSFIDCNQWISCSYLTDQIDCGYDTNPLIDMLGNKINWKCSIDNSSTDYSCISYVKEAGFIIQTNPQQKSYSSGIVVIPQEQEIREFFSVQNGLVQPYFLTEGLKSNTTYLFGVQCSSDSDTFITEHYVTPIYRNLDEFAYRGVWVKDNSGYILGGLIFLVLLIVVVTMVVRR